MAEPWSWRSFRVTRVTWAVVMPGCMSCWMMGFMWPVPAGNCEWHDPASFSMPASATSDMDSVRLT